MSTHKDNFKIWFRNIIESLYENEHAGFPILMITFPILERYLRSKSGMYETRLGEPFYDELVKMFPVFNNESAKRFWQVYRHGIMHQATLSLKLDTRISMPGYGWLSGEVKDVEIDSNGDFWVNPVSFAKYVINTIENDFVNFESTGAISHPFPSAKSSSDGKFGTSGHGSGTAP